MSVIRGEQWKLAYASEASSGYGVDPGTAYYTHQFGIVQSATMPDPAMDFVPIWGLGTNSYRNPYVIYRGKQSLNCSISDFMLIDGTPLRWAIGSITSYGTSSPYVHYTTEKNTLDSFSMHTTYVNCDTGAWVLMRRWHGGKMTRATFSAREEDFLKMSCDIVFKGYSFKDDGTGFALPGYNTDIADISPTIDCDEPYLFSYGALLLYGDPFARVRAFRLSVDNGLQAKYYLNSTNQTTRLPYEHRESRRTYKLSVDIDIEDAKIYRDLVAMGTDFKNASLYSGFNVRLTMTRGTNDYIMFDLPHTSPTCGGDSQGCFIVGAPHNINSSDQLVTVTSDILVRSAYIEVSDNISSYP
jgi:hypothetical protein